MKNKKRVISIILVACILAGALATAFVCMRQSNANFERDTANTEKAVDTIKSRADNIQAIEQGEHQPNRGSESAELELDIGKVERETDPAVIASKIEYGKKETDTYENK